MTEALIDQETQKVLKEKFQAELVDEVQLDIYVGEQNPEYSEFTVKLCQELHEIDERIKPMIYRNRDGNAAELGITGRPTVLIGWGKGCRIKYTGAPAGHETSGFIETISLVSRGESGLQPSSVEKLAQVDRDTSIQVFVTPTCPHCSRAVMMANRMAIAAKGRIMAECVEASQNMELARQLKARQSLAEKLVDNPTGTVTLTDGNFGQAIAKYPNLVVDCWAEWCGPCRMVGPIIDRFAQEYEGQVVFGKLDVDHNQEVAGRHGIMSIPTLLFFKNGQLAGKKVGALPKPALKSALQEHGLI
jgi:thioredoxin 1